ncbi:Fip1_motif-containing protein [Hexamita inflata]|uniref:Fip1 motif-containing protein n=1 Tax=Hexamita inflata TaxID=28002 RepID=A0AA86TMW0_9EUKA|nr:Fip1 motif-containing protein [Hexamita inflata]CAI9978086.1 Fip1 motif-containing protein [Hexamita inflata]
MSSDHISSSDDLVQLDDHQILTAPEPVQTQQQNIKQFLMEYGPQFSVEHRCSELDVLREIGSFQEKVKNLNFNYNFDEESYAYYSKLQNVIRLELTEFRSYMAQELIKNRKRGYRIRGYYYELGAIQDPDFRPNEYNGRK